MSKACLDLGQLGRFIGGSNPVYEAKPVKARCLVSRLCWQGEARGDREVDQASTYTRLTDIEEWPLP